MTNLQRSNGFSNLSSLSSGSSSSTNGSKSTFSSSSFSSGFGGSMFGSNNNKPSKPPDPLMQRLENIQKAYNSAESIFRFHTIALNSKAGSGGSSTGSAFGGSFGGGSSFGGGGKQQGCSEEEWKQAVKSAPEERAPVLLKGFDDLNSRIDNQTNFAGILESSLKTIQARINIIQGKLDSDFKNKMNLIQTNSNKISKELMYVLKNKELQAVADLPFTKEESDLYHKVFRIKEEMNQPNKYKAALNTLKLKAKMLKDSKVYHPTISFSDNNKIHIVDVLKTNTEAIKSLSKASSQMDKEMASIEAAFNDLTSAFHQGESHGKKTLENK